MSADEIMLSEKDVAADLGAIDPAAVPSVTRPDGQPGFTESYVGATLTDATEGDTAIPPPVTEKLATPPPRRNPTSARILTEADRVIHGERATQYGSAEDSFDRIAQLWSVHLGQKIDGHDVAILMVLMKAARAKTDLRDDTYVDIAGYAALAPRLALAAGRIGA